VYFQLGAVQAYAGDRAAAERSFNDALKLSPTFALSRAWLAYNAIAIGDTSAALANLQLVEHLIDVSSLQSIAFLPELAYAYGRIGRDADARRLFGEIQALARTADVGTGTWALAHLAVGDEDEALRQLEAVAAKAANHEPEQGLLGVMNLKMNFLSDPRIEEPRFADVLSRIRGD
jgi:tetratricopeptide (TPR) repeat protein